MKQYEQVERNYKDRAHELSKTLLHRTVFEKVLSTNQFAVVCENAKKTIQATNLVFPNEKMNFLEGLRNLLFQERFCQTLYDLLFGTDSLERRFKAFCKVLVDIGSPKWTVATYFPFIMYPDQHMFMKPIVTMKAADICAFELNYKAELNWLTYEKLMEFSQYLRRELSDLNPRDMIDIQSFIWCTGQG